MSRDSYLRRTYGISETEYDAMWIQQGGVCAICKRPPRDYENLCVDHSHRSGSTRALLDHTCNQVLGKIQDSQEWAMRIFLYLREHDGPEMKLPGVPTTSPEIQSTGPDPNRRRAMPERIEKPNWTPSDGAPGRNKAAEPQPSREGEKIEIKFGDSSSNSFILRNPG